MIEVVLQHYRSRSGIEFLFSPPPIPFASCQPCFGLVTRQPLILQDNRHSDALAERFGQSLDLCREASRTSIETTRPPEHDGGKPVLGL